MASTNQTANLHLNQWVADDPVMREDFNADNTKLDAAVAAVQASVAALPRIVTGSYTGNGADSRVISLGKKPKAVLVTMRSGLINSSNYYHSGIALENAPMQYNDTTTILSICDNGFRVYYKYVTASISTYTNANNALYNYVAIL